MRALLFYICVFRVIRTQNFTIEWNTVQKKLTFAHGVNFTVVKIVLNYAKKVQQNLSFSITKYSSSKEMSASRDMTHFCTWKREDNREKNVVKMIASVFMTSTMILVFAFVWKSVIFTLICASKNTIFAVLSSFYHMRDSYERMKQTSTDHPEINQS